MRADDAAAWADLLAAAEEVDRRGEHYDLADCAEELADPELDLSRDTLLVLGEDGTAIAYQVFRHRTAKDGARLFCEATVHPAVRGRGIGTALVAMARQRADANGAQLTMLVSETGADAVALAVGNGMEPVRWWSELDRPLGEPVIPAPVPAGITMAPLGPDYDAGRWDGPLRAAHNTAFAEHWGSEPDSAAAWVHWRTGSRAFRPACSAVATTADGAVAGYVLGFEYDAETVRTGRHDLYVGAVGTLVAHRGRGLAGAMLAHVLAAARALGFETSSLRVDAQNPTGALGVYTRTGYRLRRRNVTYALARPEWQGVHAHLL